MGCLQYVGPCPKSRRLYETVYRNWDQRLSDGLHNIPKPDAASNLEAQVLSLRWSQPSSVGPFVAPRTNASRPWDYEARGELPAPVHREWVTIRPAAISSRVGVRASPAGNDDSEQSPTVSTRLTRSEGFDQAEPGRAARNGRTLTGA